MTGEPKVMSDISMLTILLQASAIVKNQIGDPSIHSYVDTQDATLYNTSLNSSKDAAFETLNCVTDILVQDTQVLAASYDNASESSFTLVVPSPNLESDPDSIDMEFPPHESIVSATTYMPINAAVVPNPNDRGEMIQLSGPLGDIRKIEGGKCLWINEDPLRDVVNMDVETPQGLANHAESVSSYLDKYARAPTALRSQYSKSFFKYLLASSWMKLHSRFGSWRALSFVLKLENAITDKKNIIVKHVADSGKSFFPSELPRELGRGDRTLADFFLKNKDFLIIMMGDTCENLPTHISSQFSLEEIPPGSWSGFFKKLFCPFNEAVDLALSKASPLYTKETAMSFHYLLYFSFLMAGRAICAIKESHLILNAFAGTPKPPNSVEDYKRAILAAELPFRLIICVLSSNALRLHMKIWTNEGMELKSILPNFEEKAEYLRFGMDRGFRASTKKGPQASPDCEGSEGSGDDIPEDDIIEFPEDSKSLTRFYRWVTIFVAHFLAKRTLEYQCARIFESSPLDFEKPQIKILAVNSEVYSVPSWAEFERVIREAFTVEDENIIELIITTLVDRVSNKVALRPEAHTGLHKLRDIIKGKLKILRLRMHCEAVLVALLEARHQAQKSADPKWETLAKFYQTLMHDMISVSELCCPVCWELFKAVMLDIKISGCHPNVTPLALPETLSPEIYSKMIISLRTLLVSQLKPLLLNRLPETRHSRNESETGHSATSSNEGSSVYGAPFEVWRNRAGQNRAEND